MKPVAFYAAALEEHLDRLDFQRSQQVITDNLIEEMLAPVPVKTAVENQGFIFTPAGAETYTTEAVVAGVSPDLPANEISWDVSGEMGVRVYFKVQRDAAIVNAIDGAGKIVARDVRVFGPHVLDLPKGKITLLSSQPFQSFQLVRYVKEYPGQLILGPFDIEGNVSARAVGFGDFDTSVACSVPDAFSPTVIAKASFAKAETVILEDDSRLDPSKRYWNIDEPFKRLEQTLRPELSTSDSFFCYAWGPLSGEIEVAWDLVTGKRLAKEDWPLATETIVATNNPESVSASVLSAEHTPYQVSRLLKGTYRVCSTTAGIPGPVYVKINGKGILRAVEITTKGATPSPNGQSLNVVRIDMADYARSYLSASGRGYLAV